MAGSRRQDRAAPLRGRSQELSVLGKSMDAIRASGSRALMVRGEAGAGKTTLLRAIADLAARPGSACGWARWSATCRSGSTSSTTL